MLETKWRLDESRGKGFRLDRHQMDLFSSQEVDDLEGQVLAFLSETGSCTNHDLKMFGLRLEYLPKHVREALRALADEGLIEVFNEDGEPTKSFYIDDKTRTVTIKYKG
jgi:transcription initiation factor IIE alpha subunit